ncbi:ribulokinase [Reinekea sp.]|jgi:L-ribulokinase|uniref:ribulokinase n=1 Tax=Reinekea sp. TaxID=1970455 RepID=UPI0039899B90
MSAYVAGLDFGSDSVRWLVVDAATGAEIGSEVAYYRSWMNGDYCVPTKQQYRQHPKDILRALTSAGVALRNTIGDEVFQNIKAIGVDTTGSTPIAIDKYGTALSLREEFSEDPDAMFILWKDHTSIEEAEEITRVAKQGTVDYTRFVGGSYSSEWYWAKLLRVLRNNKKVSDSIHSFVEMCDWVPAILTGTTAPKHLKRSRCASGHKILWNASWGGLPPRKFFSLFHPKMSEVRDNVGDQSYTSDVSAGIVTDEWQKKLGLSSDVVVAVGAFDAHMGALGAGAKSNELVKVIGTSTCDIITADYDALGENCVAGICGQVDGSVIPGKIGLEAGQSAFGDYYAWFKNTMTWSLSLAGLSETEITKASERFLPELGNQLTHYSPNYKAPLALDWINGRRTPDANQRLTAAFFGMNLGSSVLDLFHAVVESTAFGAKKINDTFEDQGVAINKVIAIGGISRKSASIMQICADVFGKAVEVKASDQCCALGAAICGAVAADIYPSMEAAIEALASDTEVSYTPRKEESKVYRLRYQQYLQHASYVESRIKN